MINPSDPTDYQTIRAHFAAMALQGLLAAPDQFNAPADSLDTDGIPAPWYAKQAVRYADALIAELNKPRK